MTRNLFEAETGVSSFGSAYVQHDAVDLVFPDDGMTRQEFAAECDINDLMARYQKTGLLPQNPEKRPIYGDFTNLPSYQDALHVIMAAEDAFASLPAIVRRQFENDPAEFVKFADDPANIDQLRIWGLAEPLDPAEPVAEPKAPIAPAAAPAAPGAVPAPTGAATQSSS